MYVLIDEFGSVFRAETITEEMNRAYEFGVLTIIRVDGDIPMVLDNNMEWVPVRKA